MFNRANIACARGHLQILKTLRYYSILPDIDGVNIACLYGYIKILRWLKKFGILPNVEGANNAWNIPVICHHSLKTKLFKKMFFN
jgi:hypothetical protein